MKKIIQIILIAITCFIVAYLISIYGIKGSLTKFDVKNDIMKTQVYADSAKKILKLDSIFIIVYPITLDIKSIDTYFNGYVEKSKHKKNTYCLYIQKRLSEKTKIDIISHEMIHVKQFESGELEIISISQYRWHGKVYWYSQMPYEKRQFELDAQIKSKELRKKLNQIFIKNK